jgi:putative Mg2+ transporter-C (MgtC) family protein
VSLANALFDVSAGQGGRQFAQLALAFVLSSLIGVEREIRQKDAGVRTHALVGVGAALFMQVSQYGFAHVLHPGTVVLDPSRVAAQVVSGIGFIGGGLIFVRRDAVRGLTTAAVVWLTCAVGMACGGGLGLLAIAVTAMHFVVVYGYPPLIRAISGRRAHPAELRLVYLTGLGLLPRIMAACTQRGFGMQDMRVERTATVHEFGHGKARELGPGAETDRATSVLLGLRGPGSVRDLIAELSELDGVLSIGVVDDDAE